ncbi:MAG: serine hydrolase [Bacteroidales bacterium]|nr:serine hydrolase [Bacteroidales bacterium]
MRKKRLNIIIYAIAFAIFFIGITYPIKLIDIKPNETEQTVSLEDRLYITQHLCPATYSEISQTMKRYCAVTGFQGVVMVVYYGDIIYNEANGYDCPGCSKKLLNTNMSFQLASVSKQFTAAAIMKLKSEDMLDYTDRVSKYITDFPYEEVTIQQLLNHTGGLSNYMYLLEKVWNNDSILPDNQTLMRIIAEEKMSPYFTPGKRYDYSNTGYAVLASVVESITHESFPEYMEENFFAPLDMKNTFIGTSGNQNIKPLDGFARRRNRLYKIEPSVHDGIVGDKGVYTTSWDMYKWDKALYEYSALPQEVLDEAFTPTHTSKNRTIPYGYGFRIKKIDNNTAIYHNGIWEGFRTSYHRFPEYKNTILVLNNNEFNVGNIPKKIAPLINTKQVENIETRFVINAVLDDNFKVANYAYCLAKHENKLNDTLYNYVQQYLWGKKYYTVFNILNKLEQEQQSTFIN